ncbi:unnamed protein product [Acanthosepion pharaonis]|uniref:Peptidase A2 domain-containing protein n=1 Tax=Acanthosepion pharaonis TaxID=158019 RepID=A0A812CLQ4_ACAPH|nr:unnamed protein product [Sepia pharaonis]
MVETNIEIKIEEEFPAEINIVKEEIEGDNDDVLKEESSSACATIRALSLCLSVSLSLSLSLFLFLSPTEYTPAHSNSFQQPPAHSCSFQQPPAHSCSFQKPPAHSCSFQQSPAYSCGALLTSRYLFQHPLTPDDLIQCPLTSSDLFQRPLTSGYRSRTNDICRLTIHRSQIKTRFPLSTTDHLRIRLAEKMAKNTEAEINTSAALLQLPPYNSINTRSWFIQLEAIFSARKVTRQDTKYASVVQALPVSIVEEVEDIILNTPDQLPYTCLKEAILKHTARSDEDLIRDLFSNVSLGERTPSRLLRLMKSCLGNNTMAEPILRGLWMDRLPPNITQVLALVPVETPLTLWPIQPTRYTPRLTKKSTSETQHHAHEIEAVPAAQVQDRETVRTNVGTTKPSVTESAIATLPADAIRPRETNRPTGSDDDPCQYSLTQSSLLLDTGAAISVIPPTNRSALKPTPFQLRAANGFTIETYGNKELTLNINLRRGFKWSFTVADVRTPLLGADFLVHYNPAVHMKMRTLSDNTASIKITWIPSSFNTTRISVATQHDPRYVEILRRPFTQELRHKMAQLKYTPPRQPSPTIHVPQQLQDCEFIFDRNDAVKKPLTPTYQGPFKVLKRSEKHLTIDQGSRTDTISIDRVKPAFLEKSPRETEPVSTHPELSPASTTTQSQPSQPRSEPTPEAPTTPTRQTRLGRKVTFPKKYKTYILLIMINYPGRGPCRSVPDHHSSFRKQSRICLPVEKGHDPHASSLLQFPAACSFQQSPAHFCGALLTSRYPFQHPLTPDDLIQCPLTSSDLFQRPLTSGYRSRTNDLCRLTIHRSQIKTRFPLSTTDHLRLSSFFAIAISLPLCPLFSCTVD